MAMQVIKMLPGRTGRFNLALFYPGTGASGEADAAAGRRLVVVFPGDISDLEADMLELPQYSLEALGAKVRANTPPDRDMVVIRPAVAPRGLYAHYTHFMGGMGHYMHARKEPTCELGDTSASEHLLALVGNLARRAGCAFDGLTLVGFSKGASVLTRFIERPSAALLARVDAMYFVDAGLNHPGVYPSAAAAAALRQQHPALRIHLHGSARQYDPQRPFLKEEWDAMPCDSRTEYEGASLEAHFRVLFELKV